MGSGSWFQRVQSAVIGIMGLSMVSPVGVQWRRLFNSWQTGKQRAGTSIYALPVNPPHVCVHTGDGHMCCDVHVEVRGQWAGDGSLLPCGFQRWNSGPLAWQQTPGPSEPSHCPPFPLFICPSTQPTKWCHHTHERSSILG